ncbi:apolipophorins-like [Ptychodera flava]|uniref:PfG1 protein n=1 Tax=Ptychodera flava TaxID=63121 RepID=Q9U8R1_PTYFL|nr:PfG1 [Ptychodera flava]
MSQTGWMKLSGFIVLFFVVINVAEAFRIPGGGFKPKLISAKGRLPKLPSLGRPPFAKPALPKFPVLPGKGIGRPHPIKPAVKLPPMIKPVQAVKEETVKKEDTVEKDMDEIESVIKDIERVDKPYIEEKLDRIEHVIDAISRNDEETYGKPDLVKQLQKIKHDVDVLPQIKFMPEIVDRLERVKDELGEYGKMRGRVHPDKKKPGVRGDPHITTFDGRFYNYQGLCWHTLVKDCISAFPKFDLKARFDERFVDPEVKTRTVEVMVTAGKETLTLKEDNSIFINEQLMNSSENLKNMHVGVDGDVITVTLDTGLVAKWSGPHHTFTVSLVGFEGQVCGLLGNADGIPENDFKKPDGTITDSADEFGESWRVASMTC